MTSGAPQRSAVASRVERLVERAMALAIEEHDDDLVLARLAWLAHDDQAALDQAGEVCLALADVNLVVRGRAAGLLARVRDHTPGMRCHALVSYGERSADQAGYGGRADLEGARANMSTEVGDLDAALAGLYQLPLEQFVATRDQLARRLRAEGDRDTARQVAALRRPPVSAWVANQLASAAPNAVAELLDAGAALRQAQQDALAGQPGAARRLRTATAHLRAAITRLSTRAETLLARSGHAASDATLARLAATLQAAATGDEPTRASLAQGRLPGDLDPAGFGLDLGTAPAEPAAPAEVAPAAPAAAGQAEAHQAEARRAQARAAARRALEQTRRAAEQARAVLDQAKGQATSRQRAAEVAHQRAEQLAAAAQDLADRAAAAATAAEEARQAAEGADRDTDEVAERVRVAQQAVEAAEAAQDAAVAALEELDDQPAAFDDGPR